MLEETNQDGKLMKASSMPDKVKFGIKFRDGYKVEVDTEIGHQLWPVSVYQGTDDTFSSYYIWDGDAHNQLFGQLMTLIEAVIEEPNRQKAIKSLIRKELHQFEDYLKNVSLQATP